MVRADRLITFGSIVAVLVGFVLWIGGLTATAQSESDVQRQLAQLRTEIRDLRSEIRHVERSVVGLDREGTAIARLNVERLAALEREAEWTRWIVRGNLGVGGGMFGLLLIILRRMSNHRPRHEEER